MTNLVFLGGTAGANRWREDVIIPRLLQQGVPEEVLFNPIVSDWNEKAQRREDQVKQTAKYMLFVICNPHTPGNEVSAYSLVEATMALYDDPNRVVLALDSSELSPHVAKAMAKAFKDLRARFPSAPIFDNLDEAVDYLVDRLA